MDSPLDHNDVRRERERRGWSIREAAAASDQIVSNTTWGTYEQTGNLTPKIRQAVSHAFGWPLSWPEVASQSDLTEIFTKISTVEQSVRRLQAAVSSSLEDRAPIGTRLDALEDQMERLILVLHRVVAASRRDAVSERKTLEQLLELTLRPPEEEGRSPAP